MSVELNVMTSLLMAAQIHVNYIPMSSPNWQYPLFIGAMRELVEGANVYDLFA